MQNKPVQKKKRTKVIEHTNQIIQELWREQRPKPETVLSKLF